MNSTCEKICYTELQITQAILCSKFKHGVHQKDLQCVPFLMKRSLPSERISGSECLTKLMWAILERLPDKSLKIIGMIFSLNLVETWGWESRQIFYPERAIKWERSKQNIAHYPKSNTSVIHSMPISKLTNAFTSSLTKQYVQEPYWACEAEIW